MGGLLLGLPLLYTMETWWLAWTLPAPLLGLFAFVGLAVVSVVVHFVGFSPGHDGPRSLRELGQDFAELVVQSAVAAFAVLWLFGLVGGEHPWHDTVRLMLIEIVPVSFGAAVANRMLRAGEEDEDAPFGREMATFALGAIFLAFPVAPTEEIELIAARSGYLKLAVLVVTSVLVTYLALYELQFRGTSARGRVRNSRWLQLGEASAGYAVALALSASLLAGYGHFAGRSVPEIAQQVVVLGQLSSFGGALARVVI